MATDNTDQPKEADILRAAVQLTKVYYNELQHKYTTPSTDTIADNCAALYKRLREGLLQEK